MKDIINEVFPETTNSKVTARVQGLRKFRSENPRFDYYPTPDAAAAIAWLCQRNPKLSMRELIDALVIAGMNSLSGNVHK